ncbi:hypothetical protein ACHAXN_011315 [Cyclotella atomus]
MTATIKLILTITATTSCITSITLLIYGLTVAGPSFFNGQECTMTYSQFQFLPLRVVNSSSGVVKESRYRLLKFTDKRDPRHEHLYQVSGSMVENYDSQNDANRQGKGRLLEYTDNWCLLPQNISQAKQWKKAPYPHRGHPVLYIPGHWGSFSQARSIGAHGTRWTGHGLKSNKALYDIYESFQTGEGMNNGRNLGAPSSSSNDNEEMFMKWYQSSYSLMHLNGFVMDVYSLDFKEEGAALHPSRLLRQADFFTRSVETLVEGCDVDNTGLTIVAHSIGAWVVRIAIKMHPRLIENGWVKNVITLASPLRNVPYAVDAGIHDIASHLNDVNGLGNVTYISISGGLRDEMIPPEVCQIPSTLHDATNNATSEAFLATTTMGRNAKDTKYQYGMDHRAVVWCYDLLKVVREVIFALVVSSDQEMSSQSRLIIARRIILGKQFDGQFNFDDIVGRQRDELLADYGYFKTVAVQLASPYHLNSLLKLAISAILLDLHILVPLKHHYYRNGYGITKLLDAAMTSVIVPLLLLTAFSIRRAVSCSGHECQLLLGTVFILAQLSVMVYLLTYLVVAPATAAGLRRFFKWRTDASFDYRRAPFGTILLQYFYNQLRGLLFLSPLIVGGFYATNHVFLDKSDLAWNMTSVASYLFLSFLTLELQFIIKTMIVLSDYSSRNECSVAIIFLLAMVKSTHSTVIYALSLLNEWGQIDSDVYNDFLATTRSHVGSILGHHNELLICVITKIIPTFFALNAVCTYTTMRLQFNRSCDNENDELTKIKGETTSGQSERCLVPGIAQCAITWWYAWSVFTSYSQDDLLIPVYSTAVYVTYYLKCVPISVAAMDIYSAVAKSDLTLCCSVAKDHNKKE